MSKSYIYNTCNSKTDNKYSHGNKVICERCFNEAYDEMTNESEEKMSKSYELQHKEKYNKYKADKKIIELKVEKLKQELAEANIFPDSNIFITFAHNFEWDIADTNEVDLCNRTSKGIRWGLCQREAKKMVDSGEYIVVSEYLEEFEKWDEFIRDLKGE